MIAIVGGGLVGLCCAWELVQKDLEVVLYDPGQPGAEARQSASWAGAGMLAPDAESFASPLWRQRARAAALGYASFLARLGGDIDFLPPREVDSRIQDGHVDPRDLTRELRRRLDGRIQIVRQAVHRVEQVLAGQVLVTAGAWSNGITYRGVALPETIPIRGYMLAWDHVPPATLDAVLHDGPTYILQRRRGLVLAGSTEEAVGFDPRIDWQALTLLKHRAHRLFPALEGREASQCWWGFRPGTRDGLPHLRRLDERVVLAYGHYRNGILLAPWTAQWAAGELTANRETVPVASL